MNTTLPNASAVEALRAENERLKDDLDQRFEHSPHQVAKYYGRMRVAERIAAMNAAQRDEAVQVLAEVRAERDALQSQLDRVRQYAEQRAWYGRRDRTVGSARIASDLFGILGEDA